MSPRFYARLRRARHCTPGQSFAHSGANSGSRSLSFLSPLAATSALRTAGALVQPSADAPSGWLVLSAFLGLPIALWAYKVRPSCSTDALGMVDFAELWDSQCLMLVVFQRKVIYMGELVPQDALVVFFSCAEFASRVCTAGFEDGVASGRVPQVHTEGHSHRGALHTQFPVEHRQAVDFTATPRQHGLSSRARHRLLSRYLFVF
jgi:hypothetical protein